MSWSHHRRRSSRSNRRFVDNKGSRQFEELRIFISTMASSETDARDITANEQAHPSNKTRYPIRSSCSQRLSLGQPKLWEKALQTKGVLSIRDSPDKRTSSFRSIRTRCCSVLSRFRPHLCWEVILVCKLLLSLAEAAHMHWHASIYCPYH